MRSLGQVGVISDRTDGIMKSHLVAEIKEDIGYVDGQSHDSAVLERILFFLYFLLVEACKFG